MSLCENLLYVFKAARRAARAANTAATPGPPLELQAGRAQRRSAGAKNREIHGAAHAYRSAHRLGGGPGLAGVGSYREQVCSRAWDYPARPEPVKSAYGVGSADLRLLTEPALKIGETRPIGR